MLMMNELPACVVTGSTTSDPSVMELITERRASHDRPGAASRRSVGSMSSASTRLKNLVSFKLVNAAGVGEPALKAEAGVLGDCGALLVTVFADVLRELADPLEGFALAGVPPNPSEGKPRPPSDPEETLLPCRCRDKRARLTKSS